MEKVFLSFCLLFIISMASAQSTYEKGIEINGVRWATCNVDRPGTFADSPEDTGMFYQWNRNVGWSSSGKKRDSNGRTKWDKSNSSGDTWEKRNDPSPAGWRVPNIDELLTLCDPYKVSKEWTTLNRVLGMKFTDKITGNSIFLPAAGCRWSTDGVLWFIGQPNNETWHGYYWSNTPALEYDDHACCMIFWNITEGASWNCYHRSYGYCIRSVAE